MTYVTYTLFDIHEYCFKKIFKNKQHTRYYNQHRPITLAKLLISVIDKDKKERLTSPLLICTTGHGR